MAFRTERSDERITVKFTSQDADTVEEEMDWIRAAGLAASLQGHADQARIRQYRREGRCVDCGAQLEPGSTADTCGDECPTEAIA